MSHIFFVLICTHLPKKILYYINHLSIARYSFIQLSELEQCRMKHFAQGLTPQHRIQIRVLLVEPDGLKWTSDFKKNTAFIQVQKKPTKKCRGKLYIISKHL